ncbi:MAG: hypothetical protein IT490_04475 [Candidatus Contendobacter sp.]|nr:hypothetical protein [Candidatus Contendobacter sp.]
MNLISKPKRRKTQERPFSSEAAYASLNPDPIPPVPASRPHVAIWRGALIALLLVGIGILIYAGPEYYRQYREQQAFSHADHTDSINGYEQYGRDYPQGAHLAEAQQRIDEIRRFEMADGANDLKAYLDRYPHGRRSGQAQQKLAELADDQLFAAAQKENTLTAYRDYLKRFPHGQHLSEVNEMLIRQDDRAFQNAQAFNTVLAYQDYLRQFPQGRHHSDADQALIQLDDYAFKSAQQAGSLEAYQEYVRRFPQGRHLHDVNSTIAQKQGQALDDQAFQAAQNAHTVAAYQEYIRQFPQGKYVENARTAMIQKDDAAFQAERSTDTIDAYQRYLRSYPQGLHVEEARAAIAKKAQGIQQQRVPSLSKPEVNIINNTGYALTIDIAGETYQLDTDTSRVISLSPGNYPFTGSAHGLTDTGNFPCRTQSRYTWTWTIQSGHGGSSSTFPSIPTYIPPPIQYPRL